MENLTDVLDADQERVVGEKKDDSIKRASYHSAGSANQYDIESGLCVMPLAKSAQQAAEDGVPCRVLRLHPPIRKRTLAFDEMKKGTPPVIPAPVGKDGMIFLEGSVIIGTPTLDVNSSSYNWHVQGEYTFVENTTTQFCDGFYLGEAPFRTPPETAQKAVHAAKYAGYLLAGGTGGLLQFVTSLYVGQAVFENPFYSWSDPTLMPGIFMNHEMTHGRGTTIDSLRI